MKKTILTLVLVISSITLMGFNIDYGNYSLTYTVIDSDNNYVSVSKNYINGSEVSLNIPSSVTYNGNTYTVTEIADNGFQHTHSLTSVTLPNTLTTIGSFAFDACHITTIYFPPSLKKIEASAFTSCNQLRYIYITSDVTIETGVFSSCTGITAYILGDITWPNEDKPLGNNITKIVAPCSELAYYISKHSTDYTNNPERFQCIDIYITKSNGDFDNVNTWNNYTSTPNDNSTPGIDDYFIIQKGHTITLDHIQRVKSYRSLNNGVLKIVEGGQLIEIDDNNATNQYRTDENVSGVIEVVTPADENKWNFVGAPFNGYNLYAMKLSPNGEDATVVEFDYTKNDWSMNYSYADDVIGKGEGFFAWPFYSGGITFSTKEDHSTPSYPNTAKASASDFALNNGNVTVTKPVSGDNNSGRWMALSNPYPAKLSISTFINGNSNIATNTQIQGRGVYVLTNTVSGGYQTWEYKSSGDLNVGQGFFVNLASGEAITFKKSQLSVNQTQSKAESEKEFIRFAMIEGERESEVLFAHNQDAQEGYDIFDANKLFAMSHIAEPYFVVDGISLVKEEVNLLPYYATMNVKSFGNKEVKFTPKYIPEGLSVTLIDGEESIDLLQGQEYATEISAGENANRFKLLIKKSLGLSDAEELEVNISNDNRIVNIATSETDLQIEVYNALGQKVFETKALNFSLNNVSAGAYMIKAFNNKASKTQKIVIK
jgi:hypothetical protein